MIRIHIFSYAGDGLETLASAECAQCACPKAQITIIDDANHQMEEDVRLALTSKGFKYRRSTWNRGSNLRGKSACMGVMNEMLRDAKDEDILVKLDPDTALLDASWLNDLDGADFYASGDEFHSIYGCCYAIRVEAARKLRAVLSHISLPPDAPEDLTYWEIISSLRPEIRIHIAPPWSPMNKQGRWTSWCWHAQGLDPVRYAQFAVVTTGNPRPVGIPRTRRAHVIRQLQAVSLACNVTA